MAGKKAEAFSLITEQPFPSESHSTDSARLSDSERQAIREELRLLLASKQFHTSHRCLTLLRHVVEETLNGNSGSLKERLVGISVFQRDADYDTNSDPVVRMAAGEVRKKLAQYYYDPANQSKIRIELPTGSYVPEFQIAGLSPRAAEDVAPRHLENAEAEPERPAASGAQAAIGPPRKRRWIWGLAVGIAVAAASLLLLRPSHPQAQDAFERFWSPVVTSPNPVLLCMGQMRATRVQLDPNPSRNPFSVSMKLGPNGDYPKDMPVAVLADAETLANVAGLLNAVKKAYTIRGEASTTFVDLQKGPVVLLGAFNNDWTIRTTQSMRLHFEMDPKSLSWWIEDRQKPGVRIGEVPQAHWPLLEDYAVVARIFDPQTQQPTIVVAGVTPSATYAAGEFITNPLYLDDFSTKAPRDWNAKNMELLIRTNIVDGDPGPPQVVASYFWQR
jgi:hypothetical protein